MGAISSKSPLERRNTVARRSQRRSIHNVKSKVDKVFQDIKRFKGVDEDANYDALHREIDHIKNELTKKSKGLQPQLKSLHDDTFNKIEEAFVALATKLKENQEKAKKREQQSLEKAEKKKDKKKKGEDDVMSENNDVLSEVNDGELKEIDEEPDKEEASLAEATEKRKTVEVKFVQVVPDEIVQADVHNENNNNVTTTEKKRKSILKMGVPVMPGAMLGKLLGKSNSTKKQPEEAPKVEQDSGKIIAKINEIIENLQATEYQIADFVGRKHGTQYNRIRDRLNQHLIDLGVFHTSDDYTLEQIQICKNYVGSCMNFLDEKAVDDKADDDVFLPANGNPPSSPPLSSKSPPPPRSSVDSSSLSPTDARRKLEQLTKTTAI